MVLSVTETGRYAKFYCGYVVANVDLCGVANNTVLTCVSCSTKWVKTNRPVSANKISEMTIKLAQVSKLVIVNGVVKTLKIGINRGNLCAVNLRSGVR